MRCEEALLLISGHLDKENTVEEENALRAHLSVCEECRGVLQAFEEVDAGIVSLNELAPEGLRDDVMAQIRKQTAKKKRRPWYGIAIAAALTLVIGAGAAIDVYEEAEDLQTVSVSENYALSRQVPKANGDTLAQRIADEYGAPVAVAHELYYEIESYPCETLREGYLLYALTDREAVDFLAENYGCEIYEPSDDIRTDGAYALLVP